jgi:carboxymethylenebutenolidase
MNPLYTLALASLVALAQSQDPAPVRDATKDRLDQSPRHHEWVEVKHGERAVHCFVAFPEVKERAAAVLVIHENKGLTDWVRSVTDQLAEAGYVAIAPDLLSGMGPNGGRTDSFASTDEATKAIYALDAAQVTADLDAVADHALKLPACNGKLAVAGFCWGGSQSFAFATKRGDLKAAFVFYGSGPEDAAALARIACPVFGFYGENDARINATLAATGTAMKDAGKTFEPVTYAGAGHGFLRAGEAADASEANKQAREDAWKRWKTLLARL